MEDRQNFYNIWSRILGIGFYNPLMGTHQILSGKLVSNFVLLKLFQQKERLEQFKEMSQNYLLLLGQVKTLKMR